jgi:hypothetical protein
VNRSTICVEVRDNYVCIFHRLLYFLTHVCTYDVYGLHFWSFRGSISVVCKLANRIAEGAVTRSSSSQKSTLNVPLHVLSIPTRNLLIMLLLCFSVRCTMTIVRSRLSVISVNSLKLRLNDTLDKNVPSLLLVKFQWILLKWLRNRTFSVRQ